MKSARELAEFGLYALAKAGAEKAVCQANISEKHELNVDSGEINLLRTTDDISLSLTAHKDGKKGHVSVGTADEDAILKGAEEALAMASGSEPDDANDIAEEQPAREFMSGPQAPDKDLMYDQFQAMLDAVKAGYPKAVLMMAIMSFNRSQSCFRNSNGVDLSDARGLYDLGIYFSSKDGERVSSFNGTGICMTDLHQDLLSRGTLNDLLRESEEQLDTQLVSGKFVGDVIVTPNCLGDIIGMMAGNLTDGPLIAGTSIYKSSLDQPIASPLLSVHSRPVSDELAAGYSWTHDGYVSEDITLVEEGILKSFLLSLYGSRKTGLAQPAKGGWLWVVDPGETGFAEMVKSVKRGLLVNRISGGAPSDNGDFSAVAKNSYLIEDGQVKYPVSETMISGNIAQLLKNITAVSRERADFGNNIFPWVSTSGVTISGK